MHGYAYGCHVEPRHIKCCCMAARLQFRILQHAVSYRSILFERRCNYTARVTTEARQRGVLVGPRGLLSAPDAQGYLRRPRVPTTPLPPAPIARGKLALRAVIALERNSEMSAFHASARSTYQGFQIIDSYMTSGRFPGPALG
jgi:hypothetical protein